MMRRFARIRPETLEEIKAHDLDPIEMKEEWVEMSDEAAEAMERVSNEQPDLPIGCAFVDAEFKPHWIADGENMKIHFGSMRGCWPRFSEEA